MYWTSLMWPERFWNSLRKPCVSCCVKQYCDCGCVNCLFCVVSMFEDLAVLLFAVTNYPSSIWRSLLVVCVQFNNKLLYLSLNCFHLSLGFPLGFVCLSSAPRHNRDIIVQNDLFIRCTHSNTIYCPTTNCYITCHCLRHIRM